MREGATQKRWRGSQQGTVFIGKKGVNTLLFFRVCRKPLSQHACFIYRTRSSARIRLGGHLRTAVSLEFMSVCCVREENCILFRGALSLDFFTRALLRRRRRGATLSALLRSASASSAPSSFSVPPTPARAAICVALSNRILGLVSSLRFGHVECFEDSHGPCEKSFELSIVLVSTLVGRCRPALLVHARGVYFAVTSRHVRPQPASRRSRFDFEIDSFRFQYSLHRITIGCVRERRRPGAVRAKPPHPSAPT